MTFEQNGKESKVMGYGNGSLNAVNDALKRYTDDEYEIEVYSQHSIAHDTVSIAATYMGFRDKNGNMSWGAGTDPDVIRAGVEAILSAYNNMKKGDEN